MVIKTTVLLIMFLIMLSSSFLCGFKISKDYGLDKCKKAGWSFIEKNIYPRRLVKSNPFGKGYGKRQLMRLQSNLSTECVVHFE